MPDSGSHKATGRNLPSWMSSRDADKKSAHEEPADDKGKRQGRPHANQTTTSTESSIGDNKSSKLMVWMVYTLLTFPGGASLLTLWQAGFFTETTALYFGEGVVFVLSGFVNPERSTLRSQALEMGAEYQADWNTNCTLLVCAFPNTPKFRQVEADNGTIVSKDWITECHSQKQLVDIEPYLLHAGKPWRHQSGSAGASQEPKRSSSKNSCKQEDKSADSKPWPSASTKTVNKHSKNEFPTSEVKKWAIDDMKRTISWLESQEEKPDPSEIKKIAAEGILICLQDAIDSLKDGKGLEKIMEQWNFLPRVVEELNKLLKIAGDGVGSASKKETCQQAIGFKRIYELELGKLEDEKKRQKIEKSGKTREGKEGYDSDETIEMTEEEVKEAFNSVASSSIGVNDSRFGHR